MAQFQEPGGLISAAMGQTDLQADREVFDVGEIAAVFKCSREKIKRMARRGELPAFKFGNHWYVRRNDLESLIQHRLQCFCHLRRLQEVPK
jgi:excisionase family DNA binding protein